MKYILFTLLLAFTFASPSFASEFYYREKYDPDFKNDAAYKEAKPIIQACWDISLELRSGTTLDMLEGHAETSECLKKAITKEGKIIFQGKSLSPITSHFLKELEVTYLGFEWFLYNKNAACQPLCGTMWHVFPNNNYADFLEDVLYKFIWVKLEIVLPNLQ